MVGSLSEVPIRLYRPSTTTPWGFRLQGGAGTNLPLSIQRVFAGGVAEGQLNRGDELISVDNHDVAQSPHHVVEDLIKQADRELLLIVKRQPIAYSPHVSENQFASYPFEIQTGGLEEYEHAKNINQIREKFSGHDDDVVRGKVQINAKPGSTSYIPKRPNIFQKIQKDKQNVPEFGWVPKPKPSPDYQSRYQSQFKPANIQQILSSDEAVSSYNKPHDQVRHEQYERPAWLGTLRSSGGPKPWEVQEGASLLGYNSEQISKPATAVIGSPQQATIPRSIAIGAVHQPKVQVTKYSPEGRITYDQKSTNHPNLDNARIAHLQYNSPLGLYSKENAKEVLDIQTAEKPGSGTLQIIGVGPSLQTFNPSHSDVYRLVKEEEAARRKKQENQPHQNIQRTQPSQLSYEKQHEVSRSAKLEQLIHENDDQKLLYEEHLHDLTQHKPSLHYGITDF